MLISAADHPVNDRSKASLRVACLAVVAMGVGADARAESTDSPEVAVTPYRPTVSTPAALSAPGWLEVESGLQGVDAGGSTHRDSLPYSLKLAFSPDWGVRIGGEAWVQNPVAPGDRVSGLGDTSLVLKRRFAVNDQAAFGLEIGVIAPTARGGDHSGSGKTDYTATGIYSIDFAHSLHADFNAGVTQLGATNPATSRRQALWAAAVQEGLSEKWGIVAELSGTRQAGVPRMAQILAGATFSPGKRVTWDLGLVRGMTAATPTWGVFIGSTFLVSRLF